MRSIAIVLLAFQQRTKTHWVMNRTFPHSELRRTRIKILKTQDVGQLADVHKSSRIKEISYRQDRNKQNAIDTTRKPNQVLISIQVPLRIL